MKSKKNELLNESSFNILHNTQDISKAILDAEQNLKEPKQPNTLCRAKNLLVHIESMLNQTWLVPNENVAEHSNPAYANLKLQIKDMIKNIDESVDL